MLHCLRSAAVCCLLLVFVLTGCGLGGGEPTPVPTPTPTPRALMTQIVAATQAAASFAFTIEVSGAPVAADSAGLFTLVDVEGALRRPAAVLATITVRSVAGVAELRLVSLDGRQYVTNPITRQWQCLAPGAVFDPAVLFDPERGIEYLLQEGVADVTLVGTEELDGQPHYHLRGTLEGAQLSEVSAGLIGAGPVQVDLWADTATERATRIVLVDTATDPAEPSTWTMNFFDYGRDVDVRAPVDC